MHFAENLLTEDQGVIFYGHLETICQSALTAKGIERSHWLCFKTVNATAPQRAEAFLRTINKWEDAR